jgi:hypothetical protein
VKNGFVVVVLVAAGWVACMTRTSAPQGAESQARAPQALAASDSQQCAVGACPDGGTGCLDIGIQRSDAGKKTFDPPPDGGWTMCEGQSLVLHSDLDEELCVDIHRLSGLADDGTALVRKNLKNQGQFTDSALGTGTYCLTVCGPKSDRPCSKGCPKSDCSSGMDDTIRGNLDVIGKVPDPIKK